MSVADLNHKGDEVEIAAIDIYTFHFEIEPPVLVDLKGDLYVAVL